MTPSRGSGICRLLHLWDFMYLCWNRTEEGNWRKLCLFIHLPVFLWWVMYLCLNEPDFRALLTNGPWLHECWGIPEQAYNMTCTHNMYAIHQILRFFDLSVNNLILLMWPAPESGLSLEYHVIKASNPRFLTISSRRSDGPPGFLIPLSQSETRFLETFK